MSDIIGDYIPGQRSINSNQSSIKPTKQTEGKLYYEIDWKFVTGMAERMALNKQNGKYERFGWEKHGVDVDEMNQALMRHLLAIMGGEVDDDGQKYGHYYAIACNAMLILNTLSKQQTNI